MNFLIHLLSSLRSAIPGALSFVLGALGMLAAIQANGDIRVYAIVGAVIGLILGLIIKRLIPNPETMAR